jgi:hypothetical protein
LHFDPLYLLLALVAALAFALGVATCATYEAGAAGARCSDARAGVAFYAVGGT